MPRIPRWTPLEAERALLAAGFVHLRSNGGHRIYGKGAAREVVPFHAGKMVHPKIVKRILNAIRPPDSQD